MIRQLRRLFWFIVLLVVVLLWAKYASAQESNVAQVGDSLVENMRDQLKTRAKAVGDIVESLIFYLLAIHVVLTAARFMARDEKMDSVALDFLKRLTLIGGTLFFIANVVDIVRSLASASLVVAAAAGGQGTIVDPSVGKIMAEGVLQGAAYLDGAKWHQPGTWLYVLAAPFQIILSTLTAFVILVAYANLYIQALAGLFLLVFVSLDQTTETAISYLRSILAAAIQLMAVLVIYLFIQDLTSATMQSTASSAGGFDSLLAVLMLQLLGVLLIMTLPGKVASMVSWHAGGGAVDKAAQGAGGLAKSTMMKAGLMAIPGVGKALAGLVSLVKKAAKASKTASGLGESGTKAAGDSIKKSLSSGLRFGKKK
jgi:type IV secretory pathway TrbL component